MVKVKLMCSYGGKIQFRLSNTNQLTYHGGDTKLLTVDHNVKFSDLVLKLSSLCSIATEFRVKYQFPGLDLDSLISLSDDDDVDHMMFEYHTLLMDQATPARIRLFLFGVKNQPKKNPGSGFLINPDYLFGFDKEFVPVSNSEENQQSALDLLQIPGIIVPGYSGSNYGTAKKDNNYGRNVEARDGHVSNGGYVHRVPELPGGGQPAYYAVPGMVNWGQPVYGILKPDQKMGVNNQLSEEIKFNQKNV